MPIWILKEPCNKKYYEKTSLLIKDIKSITEKDSFFIINNNAINILLLSDYNFKRQPLLVNRFSSNITENEFYERMIIFAKHNGWSYSDFESFMMPGKIQSNNNLNLFNDLEFIESGLGYYLNFHNVLLNNNQLKDYRVMLNNLYNELDFQTLIAKYNVKYILDMNNQDNSITIEKKYD